MNVLVIGKGGREHALAWKLSLSPRVKKLFAPPGNPGTATIASNIPIEVDDIHWGNLAGEPINVRMTGCPNGCVRPYQSDIGLVGRSGEKYMLFVGGHVNGTRLNFMLKDLVLKSDVVPMLRHLLVDFKSKRNGSETFGDYCHRLGKDQLLSLIPA